jgi:hypothetical protein
MQALINEVHDLFDQPTQSLDLLKLLALNEPARELHQIPLDLLQNGHDEELEQRQSDRAFCEQTDDNISEIQCFNVGSVNNFYNGDLDLLAAVDKVKESL